VSVLSPSNPYTVSSVITNPGAVTNLVVHAAATKPLAIVRAKITLAQATIPTAANARVRLGLKTAAGTYTAITQTTFVKGNPSDPTAGFTAGFTATAEGTDGNFFEEGWGSATGWIYDWNPTPEEYILVPAGVANGFFIKHNVAPPAGNYAFTLVVHEIG
jgi:hypothetical protein